MNLNLSELLTHLVNEKNFYAIVASHLKRVLSPGLGTMAVGLEQGRVVLYVDPDFLAQISLGMGLYVLEHEMVHVIMDHIPRYLELLAKLQDEPTRKRASLVYQVAMDCADNSLLRRNKYFTVAQAETRAMIQAMHPDAPVAETAGMLLPEHHDLPEDRSFEFYQHELMARCRSPAGDALLVDLAAALEGPAGEAHRLWGNLDGERGPIKPPSPEELLGQAEQARTQIKGLLRKALRESSNGRGTVPGDVAEWLEDYLAEPIVPWWETLTSRVKTATRAKRSRSISRPNRALLAIAEEDGSIIPALGRVRDPRFRVFFMVDTSGSMSGASLQIARSELTHLLHAEDDMEVRVMHGDADVHFDQVFHSGAELPSDVHGRGGTDFDAYFEHMGQYAGNDETAPDVVIVYTDGYAPAVAREKRLPDEVPVIWLLTPSGSARTLEGYGEVIVCDPAHNETWHP